MSVAAKLREQLATRQVRLVAVSKTYPAERLLQEYEAGQRVFGENKVQELVEKYETLPKNIEWHFIGHLQRNKVKYIAPFVNLIHAVDSYELLLEIDKQAAKNQRVIDVLLQFHIAEEESKFGLGLSEGIQLAKQLHTEPLAHVRVCGVMGMASFTDNTQQVSAEFETLANVFQQLKRAFYPQDEAFHEISMGMSGDWELAIEQGSTLVRIGSLIFGAR